uniref:Uncharacterized protein n=1 Tax=Panagrolaimus sp. JU765 TaxID=591449 RepID=A0AC34R7L8_9BILA
MMEVDSPEMMNEQVEKLFTHKLTDAERKTLEAIKRELDADFERRCKMLMDRLEVTSMAFAASSKLIDKEDEFKQVYSAAKEAI